MNSPLVSIIIPTYNYAHYIKDAINSILAQDYPKERIEIIVVDDGSLDNTKEVLKPFTENELVRYFYQHNKGKANATRNAVQNSQGKYIFNLDADDYFLQGKISETVKLFETNDDIVHVATAAKVLYQKTQEWEVEPIPEDICGKPYNGIELLERFYNSNILFGGGSTYAARSSVLKSINIPDAVDMYIDEFLILSVLPFGKSFFIKEPLSVWRVHTSNYSGNTSANEKQFTKTQRLLHSSAAILAFLKENRFKDSLIKIYELKDATRRIAFKENLRNKKTSDIFKFAVEVFFELKPQWHLIKNYQVINRLIPTVLFNFLKKIIQNVA
jgi:glycosyltransferase involved in cell wall biosynthesis